jgi:hypothetical protein
MIDFRSAFVLFAALGAPSFYPDLVALFFFFFFLV